MSLFKEIEGDCAIVRISGVYKQLPLFTRNGYLYAAIGSNGYVRLKSDGTTSKPNMSLEHLETELELYHDSFSRLGTKRIPNAKKLTSTEIPRLISAA